MIKRQIIIVLLLCCAFAVSGQAVDDAADESNLSGGANTASRLTTAGVSAGTSFIDPWIIITLRGTYAPLDNFYIEAGLDFGFISSYGDVNFYWSLYPFVHVGYFMPFAKKGGWYLGAGVGYMFSQYGFIWGEETVNVNTFAIDLTTGFNILNFLDISFTQRMTLNNSTSSKISVGYVYRF